MTARVFGCCAPILAPTKRLRSNSSTTCCRGCHSRSRRSRPTTVRNPVAFHWHVLDQGIRHVYIRPATPRLNGKVERSHRIDDEEFYRMLAGVVIDDAKLFNNKLHEWERFYNFARPHGALGGQTPYERLRQLTRPSV